MNTTITTTHASVAEFILRFAVVYMVDVKLTNTTPGVRVLHLEVVNPFLLTRLQDQLIGNFHSHMFDLHHSVAA